VISTSAVWAKSKVANVAKSSSFAFMGRDCSRGGVSQ
jgi:hypothetical protein